MTNLVIDCGSYTTKFGAAGDEIPQQFRSCAYRPRALPAMMTALSDVQRKFFESSNQLKEQYMLNVDALGLYEIRPLFDIRGRCQQLPSLLDFVLKQQPDAEKLTLFEANQQVQQVQLATGGAFALYASGRVEGLVLSIGDTQSFVQPVVSNQAPSQSNFLSFLGGRAVTNQLLEELRAHSAESLGFDQLSPNFNAQYDIELLYQLKHQLIKIQSHRLLNIQDQQPISFALPDGSNVQFPQQALFNSSEVLFAPRNFQPSVVDLVRNAAQTLPLDVRARLLKNIVLTGGTSLINGFDPRLFEELTAAFPNQGVELFAAPKNRDLQQWQGASACALLSGFSGQYLHRQRWLEEGRI